MEKYFYELTISFDQHQIWVRRSEPSRTYFSNLTKLLTALNEELKSKGWEKCTLSYSTVYRSFQNQGKYITTLKVLKTPYQRIEIRRVLLNPTSSTIGLEEMP